MLTTPELIIALERRGLLPPGDVARIRQLYENSPTEFVPRVMFKWLVSRQRLTAEQAERLQTVDANLSAVEALDRVLGLNDDLELAPDDDGTFDEDTKDMPAGAADDLTLAPPGTAPFSDSPSSPRKSLIPAQKPAASSPTASPQPAAPTRTAAAELIDELLGDAVGAGPLGRPAATLRLPTKRNRWDSPLILVGGGALLLLVALGAFLTWRVAREGGDTAFAAAEESYRTAGYATAVERYDRFLTDYPRHRSAGTAIVHRGLAQLRAAVEASADWPRTLETAKRVLPEIAVQPEFAASKADLAALLPDLAENLAKQAAAKLNAAATADAVEARKLIDKYVGATDAIAPRLQQIDALLAAAERRLARQERVTSTVAAIRQAAAARDLDAAAKARAALLGEFPDTADEPEMAEAMAALTETKRQAVRFAAVNEAAATQAPPSSVVRKVTLATRRGETIAGVDDVYFAAIEGTLFAFNAADGRIRWTRTVGFDAGSPVVVEAGAGKDVLLYDGVEQALVRVAAADGALRWRQPRAASAGFLVERDRVFVTMENRLLVIDAVAGGVTGEVVFPTALAGLPVSDPRERVRYQLGRSDDLYVVSNDDFRCLQVYYVGHAAGSIAVAPTCVGPYVLLAENSGEQTRLRLLETGADGAGLKELATRLLDGRTTLPPQVSQRLTAVVTNGGPVELLDLSGAADRKPLEPVARLATPADRIVRRHFIFRGTQLWLGGKGLTRYEFQPNLGKLAPVRSVFDDRTTLQAPQLAAGAVICRAQPSNFAQPASVTAIDAEQGKMLWETSQLSEFVGPPLVASDGKSITVVTAAGAAYDVVPDTPQLLDRPTVEFGAAVADFEPAELPAGGRVFVVDVVESATPSEKPAQALLTLEPIGAASRTTRTEPLGRCAAAPTPFRDGVVVPGEDGQVHFVDPRTGRKKAEPFQPPTTDRAGSRWSRAVVLGDAVVLTDGARLYRLAIEEQPQPFLKAQASTDLGRPSQLIGAIGQTVYVADAAGELTAYSLADLRPGTSWKIRGARGWRTGLVGDRLLALTSTDPVVPRKDTLLCLTGEGVASWQTTLDRGAAAAKFFVPVADGADYLAMDDHGDVVRLDGATGKEKGRKSLGVAPATAPILVGDQLLLTTQAGELLWIAKP